MDTPLARKFMVKKDIHRTDIFGWGRRSAPFWGAKPVGSKSNVEFASKPTWRLRIVEHPCRFQRFPMQQKISTGSIVANSDVQIVCRGWFQCRSPRLCVSPQLVHLVIWVGNSQIDWQNQEMFGTEIFPTEAWQIQFQRPKSPGQGPRQCTAGPLCRGLGGLCAHRHGPWRWYPAVWIVWTQLFVPILVPTFLTWKKRKKVVWGVKCQVCVGRICNAGRWSIGDLNSQKPRWVCRSIPQHTV